MSLSDFLSRLRKPEPAPDAVRASAQPRTQASKGLPRFLAALGAKAQPVLIDLGSVVGVNITFFGEEYGCKIFVEDLSKDFDRHVRDDRVHLKTLTGLKRVHVILRRLDDDFCDPLELRAASTLGVPGLVQAWRAGHVVVANALGTGMLESPGLLSFLPAASERLLGEPLAIPSVDTWWCGEAGALERDLAGMVIKPAFPDAPMEPVFAGDLDRSFKGVDVRSGKIVFETRLATSVQGFPISFAVDGKQYVAVATGLGGGSPRQVPATITPELRPPNRGQALYVFALPEP